MSRVWITALLVLACGLPAQSKPPQPSPRVGAFYFYWYKWPDQHFPAPGQAGHLHHLPDREKVDYTDPAWHETQFAAMADCGIDIALPVYWGVPPPHDSVGQEFSQAGLRAMVTALGGAKGTAAPRVQLGMFYDTTTLTNGARRVEPAGGKTDLRGKEGKNLFCGTVLSFFAGIPPRLWARIDGRPLVVLYGSFGASAWSPTLGRTLRKAFAAKFPGEGLFLIADGSWGEIGQDRSTGWGAALHGPKLLPGVAQVGPGYDDRQVPDRNTATRDREGGAYYRWSWRQAVMSRPELVLIETWNELHEGSEICATKETGRLYLDLTKEWVRRLRAGDPGPEVALASREPRPFHDTRWGAEAKRAAKVFVDYTGTRPERFGLREVLADEGPFKIERRSLRPRGPLRGITLVCFQVSDFFAFDTDRHLQVVVDATPVEGRPLELEFDARGDDAESRFRIAGRTLRRGPGESRRTVFDLPHARFANRQNEATDFRIRVADVRAAIRRIEVRAAPR